MAHHIRIGRVPRVRGSRLMQPFLTVLRIRQNGHFLYPNNRKQAQKPFRRF